MALPRILSNEDSTVRVMKVRGSSNVLSTKKLSLYPVHSSFFLRQSVASVLDPQGLQHAASVGTWEVVALSASAVVQDLVSAMGIADSYELVSDFLDGLVPTDFGEGSIFHTFHRGGQPVTAVLIVVDT